MLNKLLLFQVWLACLIGLNAEAGPDMAVMSICVEDTSVTVGITNLVPNGAYVVEHIPALGSADSFRPVDGFTASFPVLNWSASDANYATQAFFRIKDISDQFCGVAITEPHGLGGSVTITAATISVAGIVEGGASLTWELNGTPMGTIPSSEGGWRIDDVNLNEGLNNFVVTATVRTNQAFDAIDVYRNMNVDFTTPLYLSQEAVPISVTTNVDFEIGVSTGTVGLSAVDLLLVDTNGDLLSVASEMKDDGTVPDRIAGDGMYACRLSIFDDAETSRWYQARATVAGGNTGKSEVRGLHIFTPLTVPQVQEEEDMSANVQQHATSPEALATWLRSQAGVTVLWVSPDEVAWISPNGISRSYIFGDEPTEIQTAATFRTHRAAPMKQPTAFPTDSNASSANIVSNNRVLIWAPPFFSGFYGDVLWTFEHAPALFSVTNVLNKDATIASIADWGNYGTLYIATHGVRIWSPRTGHLVVGITTADTVDWRNFRYGMGTARFWGDTNEYYVVPPDYVEGAAGMFPHSFVYLPACRSAKYLSLPAAFLRMKAAAVFGFRRAITNDMSWYEWPLTRQLCIGHSIADAVRTANIEEPRINMYFPVLNPPSSDLILCHVTDVYVAADGSDSHGMGSKSSPWQTITNAVRQVCGSVDCPVTIHVSAGTYQGNLFLSGYQSLLGGYSADFTSRNVEDRENTIYRTVVDGGSNDTVVVLDGRETRENEISGFVIRNGRTDDSGGGINGNDSGAFLHHNTVYGNVAGDSGGGISIGAGGLVEYCYIISNQARWGGGVYVGNGGTARHCDIVNNEASEDGGGVNSQGLVTNCTIVANRAPHGGGVGQNEGGEVRNCKIIANIAEGSIGGGIHCYQGGDIYDSLIVSNEAAYGGGIGLNGGGFARNCIISYNQADSGGGITCNQGGDIYDSSIISNEAAYGGGIGLNGGGSARNCIISYNQADSGGGITCNQGGYAWGCTIEVNRAVSSGAGAWCNDGAVFDNCTIRSNEVTTGDGGGLCVLQGASAQDCTISGNKASQGGGGLLLSGVISNCTIKANDAAWGGGIDVAPGGIIWDSQISSNSATISDGGGVHMIGGESGLRTINGGSVTFNSAATFGGGISYNSQEHTVTNVTCENNTCGDIMGSCDIYDGASMEEP